MPGSPAVTALGRLVPAHHTLQTFEGSPTWYGDQTRLFTLDGDYVEFEDPGFQPRLG